MRSQEEIEEERREAAEYLKGTRAGKLVRACFQAQFKPAEAEAFVRAEAEFAKADAIDRLASVLERMLERAEQEDA